MPNILITVTHIIHICDSLVRQWIKQVLSELTHKSSLVNATFTYPPNYDKTHGGASAIVRLEKKNPVTHCCLLSDTVKPRPALTHPRFVIGQIPGRRSSESRAFDACLQTGAERSCEKADGKERIHFLELPPSASSLLGVLRRDVSVADIGV